MPMYEYQCKRCGSITEIIRPIRKRNDDASCDDCAGPAERIISIPTMTVWNADRKFPNLSPHGDGTRSFKSQAAYEGFLKEKGWGEVSTGGRMKRSHGAKVTTYGTR